MDLLLSAFHVSCRDLCTYEELLLQVVTIEIVLSRVKIPAADLLAIHAVKIIITNITAPIILGEESTVRFLPRLILHLGRYGILGKSGQGPVSHVGARIRERDIVQTPQRSEFTQSGQIAIDEVLIRAVEAIVDNPMEIPFSSCELDIDPVGPLVEYRSRQPLEI